MTKCPRTRTSDFETRFGGIARPYGASALHKPRHSHVCVVGIGEVGCWVVEAMTRSGVDELTLADLDAVCITNTNRQAPAIEGTIGRTKVELMAERVRAINPGYRVHLLCEFFTADNAAKIAEEVVARSGCEL